MRDPVVSIRDIKERLVGGEREQEMPVYRMRFLQGVIDDLQKSLAAKREGNASSPYQIEDVTADRARQIVDRYAVLRDTLSFNRMSRVLFSEPGIKNTSESVQMAYESQTYPPMFDIMLDLLEEQIDFIERTGQSSLDARSGLIANLRSEEERNRMARCLPPLRSWKENQKKKGQSEMERAALGEFPKQLDAALGRSQRDFDGLLEELSRVEMPTILRARRPDAYRKKIRGVVGEDGSTWMHAEQLAQAVEVLPKPEIDQARPPLSDAELISVFQQSKNERVVSVSSMRGEDFGRLLRLVGESSRLSDGEVTVVEGKWKQEKTGLEKKQRILKTRVGILRDLVGLTKLSGFTEGKEPDVFIRTFLEEKRGEWPSERS